VASVEKKAKMARKALIRANILATVIGWAAANVGVAFVALMLACGIGHTSTLFGDTIDVQYVWPSVGSVYQDLGTITATNTLQTVTFQPYFNVEISGSTVVVNDSGYGSQYSGSFNGQYLIDNSVATFPSYALDPSSVLTGGTPNITIVGNTLEIDFHGLTFPPGSQLVLDFGNVSQTPLPAALPLFATGLGALGLLGWRRKRKALAA
jgi:hypothetical protein